ncbi:glycosyltransferase family 2 protein [Patescibacteria group bacterium]|nr:glycosyltransferase family 2 protein [Patescibacteria group bacterium]
MKITAGFISYEKDTYKYLGIFLPSLIKALDKVGDYKLFCIDNSVNDLSNLKYIQENYPQIETLNSGKNLGFSKAYNIILEEANKYKSDYFFIINPDTYLEEDSVCNLLDKIENNASLGSVSPTILQWNFPSIKRPKLVDSLGLSLKSGLYFVDKAQAENLDKLKKNKDNHIIGISGAAGIYRMSALNKVKENNKYFDENMFMYKEDVDLAYRLFLQGYSAKTVDNAYIYHDRTTKKEKNRSSKSMFARKMSFLNQHIIYIKYFRLQNLRNKIKILSKILLMFIYILLKERFQIKNYFILLKKIKNIVKY